MISKSILISILEEPEIIVLKKEKKDLINMHMKVDMKATMKQQFKNIHIENVQLA